MFSNSKENPTTLTAMDVMSDVSWTQAAIAMAEVSSGNWCVEIETPGTYTFKLRRWPEELPIPLEGVVSNECTETLVYPTAGRKAVKLAPKTAGIRIFDQEVEVEPSPGSEEATITLDISQAGITTFEAWFIMDDDKKMGAYFVVVEKVISCSEDTQKGICL